MYMKTHQTITFIQKQKKKKEEKTTQQTADG